jgi:quinol monooxygenase YgiN
LPFFVAVHQEVRPELLDEVLATMRGDFAQSYRAHPGRRSSRIFQQLDRPTSLVAMAEWDSERDFEKLRQTPSYQKVTERADPPARIESLTRLRSFARMSRPPAYVACIRFTAPEENADALEAVILGEVRQDVESSEGLLGHEVFRVGVRPGQLLIVHSWASMDALEQFRAETRPRHRMLFQGLGTMRERFTGTIAVQYSRQDATPVLPASQ